MLSPPVGFTDEDLISALAEHWHVTAESVTYRAVGFGSHNWEVAADTRWFAKVDENRDVERLRAALRSAADVPFAVAPVPTRAGEPLAVVGRFAVTLYPFVEGESFDFGDYRDEAHRRAALDMVVTVHRTPPRHALADDFAVPALPNIGDAGPYSRRAAELLARHASAIKRRHDRYRELVARVDPTRAVLTHGEPHPGNTLRTTEGWRLIDWDTALVAPPERDLWHLATADTLIAYEEATGRPAAGGDAGAVPNPVGPDRPGRGGGHLQPPPHRRREHRQVVGDPPRHPHRLVPPGQTRPRPAPRLDVAKATFAAPAAPHAKCPSTRRPGCPTHP